MIYSIHHVGRKHIHDVLVKAESEKEALELAKDYLKNSWYHNSSAITDEHFRRCTTIKNVTNQTILGGFIL